jgi:ribosomal-protein-alanine N-acetyltransferase
MPPPFDTELRTDRLVLRTFGVEDAERVVVIQSNWNVARMLRAAAWPVTVEATRAWLASHREEWAVGTAYRFAVTLEGRVVGCADIDEIAGGRGDLGYWLDEAVWGRGLATEAAGAVMAFAWDVVGLQALDSGHAEDNKPSGNILIKLGFQHTSDGRRWSNPRGCEIVQKVYLAVRP